MRYLLQEIKRIKVIHLLGIFFLLLPFSHMFWRNMPIWTAQNRFFHLSILIIFGYSLFNPKETKPISNFPLACLFIWLTFITSQWWYAVLLENNQYPILTLFPYLSFLFVILFYKLTLDYFNINHINKLLNLFIIPIGIISIFSILQYFNLDQFYKNIDSSTRQDSVVGILGNQTHSALYLSICLPILYYIKSKLSTIFIILTYIAILLSNSATALVISIIITIIYNLYFRIRFKHERLIAGILFSLSLIALYFSKIDLLTFFNPTGRIEFWNNLLITFKQFPITGAGLGRLQGMLPNRIGTPFQNWGHAHNEFLQIMIEGGLIALVLVIGCILHYFITFKHLKRTELTVCLMTIFTGFLLSGLVSFPAHLAVPSTLGMFSYAGLYCLKGEI